MTGGSRSPGPSRPSTHPADKLTAQSALAHHDGRVPVPQHVEPQLQQPPPEVVGVVAQLRRGRAGWRLGGACVLGSTAGRACTGSAAARGAARRPGLPAAAALLRAPRLPTPPRACAILRRPRSLPSRPRITCSAEITISTAWRAGGGRGGEACRRRVSESRCSAEVAVSTGWWEGVGAVVAQASGQLAQEASAPGQGRGRRPAPAQQRCTRAAHRSPAQPSSALSLSPAAPPSVAIAPCRNSAPRTGGDMAVA